MSFRMHTIELIQFLAWRQISSRYKQTLFTPIWFVLQPILTTLLFTAVFGIIIGGPTDEISPSLFYFCGLLVWHYTSQSFGEVSGSFKQHSALFQSVYIPRITIPLSVVIANLHTLLLQALLFVILFLYMILMTEVGQNLKPNIFLFLLPAVTIQAGATALGAGLWIASLSVRHRDLRQLTPLLSQVWMYATPIVYPLSAVPERFQPLFALNPLTSVVETYRHAFFGSGTINIPSFTISLLVTLVLVWSGIALFNKVEKTAADTL